MVNANIRYKPAPRFHADGITVTFGTSQDSRILYDATNDEWTVQSKDAGGTQTDRFKVKANQDITLVELYNDDPGATGVQLDVHHDSASPADNDVLFHQRIYGEDDGGAKTQYGGVEFTALDVTDATEDGKVTIETLTAGTLRAVDVPAIAADDVFAVLGLAQAFSADRTFNDNVKVLLGTGADSAIYYDGTDTFLDLRAVGTGDLMVALAGSFPSPDADAVHIWGGSAGTVSAPANPMLVLENDSVVRFTMLFPDTQSGHIMMRTPSESGTNGIAYHGPSQTPASTLEYFTAGTSRLRHSAAAFAFQEATTISTDTGDLTLSAAAGADVLVGDDATILHVDGGENGVGIGDAPPSGFGNDLYLESAANRKPELRILNTTSGANGLTVEFHKSRGGAAISDNDVVVQMEYHAMNSTPAMTEYGAFNFVATDATAGTEDGEFHWYTIVAGTEAKRMTLFHGLQMGSPTRGDKGTGTINVAGDIYKNNTAYANPDYVFEQAFTGRIDRFRDNPGAAGYRRISLAELEDFSRTQLCLPGFHQAVGIFERADKALEAIEDIYLHLFEIRRQLER